MTSKLWLGLFLFVVLVGYAYSRGRPTTSSAEARRLVSGGAVLLDVRTPSEFASEHIEGAMNIPVAEVESRLSELPDRKRPVVVYCRSGRRSAQAKEILERSGYENVHDVGAMSSY